MVTGITETTDQRGHLAALPVNAEQLHAQQRRVTHSVIMDKVQKWRESKQGREWSEERKMLLRADAPDDVPEEQHAGSTATTQMVPEGTHAGSTDVL